MTLGRHAIGEMPIGLSLTDVNPSGLATPLKVRILDSGQTYVRVGGNVVWEFSIKRGDRLPALQVQLSDANGAKPSLSGATALLKLRNVTSTSTTPVVSATCTIVDAGESIVSYAWGSSDTSTAMECIGEIEVTYGSGLTQTFPSPGHLQVHITDDV